jgi:hypothetical protein
MFVVSLAVGLSLAAGRREFAPSETITIKTRRKGKQPGLAATCKTILIPICDFSCSRLSEF